MIVVALLWLAAPSLDAGTPPDGSAQVDAQLPDGSAGGQGMPDAAATRDTTALIPVSGTVFVRGSRDIMSVANLFVDGQAMGETDQRGQFTLPLAAGPHVIEVSEPGFESLVTAITVTPGMAPLTFRLTPTAGPRYETVVTSPPETPRVHLEQEQITRTPGTLGDPFRVIESLPGVAPVLWPLPVYAIRGANPGNTGFFIDGLRVPGLFHFALGPAVVHPHFLGGLDFYSGVAPLPYGRSVAGVVAASTAAPPADRLRGSLDLRIYDVGALLSSPFDGSRGTATVAGRFGYPGAVLSQVTDEVSLQYWDYQARIDHPLGPGVLTLFLLGSYDSFERKQDYGFGGEEERLALIFHRADLRWRAALGRGRLFAALGAGFDQTSVPYDRNGEIGAVGKSLSPRLRYEHPLGEAVDWRIGADGELSDYDTKASGIPPEISAGFIRPRQMRSIGLWSELLLRLGGRVTLTSGVRADHYQEGDGQALDIGPRVVLTVRATDRLSFNASAGRSSQLPSLPLQLPGFDGFGLAQHGLQTAWQGAVGAQAALVGSLTLETTAYLHRYVLTDIRDPDLGDPLLADFLTRRQAMSYGLELMVRRPPSAGLHGWLAYTLSRALRAFEGGVVGPADWDQRHILNLVAGYRWRRWTFGGRIHLNTGRFVKIDDTTPAEFDRLPTFYQLDFRVDRRFLLDRIAIEVFLEVVNTTLTRQVVALRQKLNGYEEDGFRIALPSLGMRVEF